MCTLSLLFFCTTSPDTHIVSNMPGMYSASLSTILILIQLFLGVAFISLTIPEDANDYRTAGILEWIIAFLGTIYLWLFCGFFDR